MKKFYSLPEFASMIEVNPQTLRDWDSLNKFKPHHRTPGGHRFYSREQLDEYFNVQTTKVVDKPTPVSETNN